MSEYRDESLALKQRIAELETARSEASAALAKRRVTAENARRTLDERPTASWSNREWFHAIASLLIALVAAWSVPELVGPIRPSPCPRAPLELPDGLGLYVWGTVVEAPLDAADAHPVGQRCMFWIDVGTDRVTAQVTGVEVVCGGTTIYRGAQSTGDQYRLTSASTVLTGRIGGTYDVVFTGGPDVMARWGLVSIDTKGGAAALRSGHVMQSQGWRFSLDGPAKPRASSLDRPSTP
jgi:hypothetical protein